MKFLQISVENNLYLVPNFLIKMNKLLIVGTVAFDSIKTPFGEVDKILGGSGMYIGISSSVFNINNAIVSVVGGDFPEEYLSLFKNNQIVQSSTTEDMLWGIDEIIAYVSQYFTLKIGDIIFTGTPSGVGKVQSNDFLKGYIGEEEFFSIKVK